jgi:hypothetical protein
VCVGTTDQMEKKMDSLSKIEAIKCDHPDLTRWGFWLETRDGFEAARIGMTSKCGIEEFESALLFLSACEHRKSVSKFSSYGWKHRAESWFRDARGKREYVSNGMFIAAALSIGMPMERIFRSVNCRLGISKRSWGLAEHALEAKKEGDALRVTVTHFAYGGP